MASAQTSRSLLGQAIIPQPATNNDNLIQPLLDTVSAIVLAPHSVTQSAPLMQFQPAGGGALTPIVDASGNVSGGSLTNAVILAPATSARNVIQPTADTITALQLQGHSSTQSADICQMWYDNGIKEAFRISRTAGPAIFVSAVGVGGAFTVQDPTASNTPLVVFPKGFGTTVGIGGCADTDIPLVVDGNSATQSADLFQAQDGAFFNAQFGVLGTNGLSSGFYAAASTSDTHAGVKLARFDCSLPTGLAASFTSRLNISMVDFAATRQIIRLEANGTAGALGFYGAAAVVQQSNASAAGVSGIVAGAAYSQADMAAVKSALTAIRAGLAANGVLANTA